MAILKDWIKELEYTEIIGDTGICVEDVIYDSRKAAPGNVFVCIKGARADGHKFAREVYEKGVRVFIAEMPLNLPEGHDAVIVSVKDSRKALALLAAAKFGHPFNKMISIGVTGTKGKTTSTTMLRTILESCGEKVGLIGTNGCFIDGVMTPTRNTTPESYELQADFAKMAEAGCRYVVMECSSQGFKLDRTYGLKFNFGVFLNISPDHIGPAEHEDFNEYLQCKSRLLAQSEVSVVNRDDAHADEVVRASGCDRTNVLYFSVKQPADQTCFDIRYISDKEFTGTEFKATGLFNGNIRVPLPGYFNIENTLSVLSVCAKLGLPADKCREGILKTAVNGRMEVVVRNEKFTVFVDYAHNEISMVSLLETLRRDYRPKRLVVLFGCGGNRSKDRRTNMGKAAAKSADFTVITSDNPRYEKPEDIIEDIWEAYRSAGGKKENCVTVPDRRDAIRYAMEHAQTGDMIAVIGKGHEDYIEINGERTHFLDREVILEEKEKLGL